MKEPFGISADSNKGAEFNNFNYFSNIPFAGFIFFDQFSYDNSCFFRSAIFAGYENTTVIFDVNFRQSSFSYLIDSFSAAAYDQTYLIRSDVYHNNLRGIVRDFFSWRGYFFFYF